MHRSFLACAFLISVCILLVGCDQSPNSSTVVASKPTNETIEPSQAQLEDRAESLFNQIDTARTNYPPLGADPTAYNNAIIRAYRAWERAADAAYGNGWKEIWRTKHAGSTAMCDTLHAQGMPYDACADAAASEGDITPLDDMLMKCPSWEDPTGAIFNPHDPEACARRERMKQAESQSPTAETQALQPQ